MILKLIGHKRHETLRTTIPKNYVERYNLKKGELLDVEIVTIIRNKQENKGEKE